ncbi:hypothetical protein [Nostoc sp.]
MGNGEEVTNAPCPMPYVPSGGAAMRGWSFPPLSMNFVLDGSF